MDPNQRKMGPRVKKLRKGVYEFRGKTIRRDPNKWPSQPGAWYAEARGRTVHESSLKNLVAYIDKILGPEKRRLK